MTSFSKTLHERLQTAAAARAARRDEAVSVMDDVARRRQAFEPVADEIHRTLIRPMVNELVRAFDNGTVEHYLTTSGYGSRCQFSRTDLYPATVELRIGIIQAPDGAGALLTYQLHIIPVLMSFTGSDSCPVNLEHPDLDGLHARLAEWLLRFTDTYLRLESEPTYQQWHTHLDPVCGMHLTAADVACVLEREGRKIYFCSADCRARFEAHPVLYLTGVSPLTTPG